MPRWLADLIFSAMLAGVGGVTVFGAREFGAGWSSSGPEPGAFPYYMGIVIIAASLVNAGQAVTAGRRRDAASGATFVTGEQLRRIAGFVLPILAFVIVSQSLGLYVGMALYLFGTLAFQNAYPFWKAGAIALAAPLFTYLLIERAFKVAVLKGPIESALGL